MTAAKRTRMKARPRMPRPAAKRRLASGRSRIASPYAAASTVQIERRTIPGETEAQAVAEIQAIVDRLAAGDLRQQLGALVPNECGARCEPPVVEVLENSNVARAICEDADRFGADVVCMASHGSGASHALHGSVTKGVLKRLRRPLLVVQRPED